MDKATILGLIRHGLTTLGGALVADGLLSSSQVNDGVGAIVILIGLGWSVYQKRQQQQQLAAAKKG